MMQVLRDNYKKTKTLHHAYVLEGDKNVLFSELIAFLENDLEIKTRGNPNFWHEEAEMLGIDDARRLKSLCARKSVNGGKKIFVIAVHSLSLEAQNSLLKLFEEPLGDAHFFILISSAHTLLQTLRSRCHVLKRESGASEDFSSFPKKEIALFLESGYAKRAEIIKSLIEGKDVAGSISFLNGIEVFLSEKYGVKEMATTLSRIEKIRSYLYDRAPSVKLLLEYMALATPTLQKRD